MRIKIFCGALFLLMVSTLAIYAQSSQVGLPCGDTDVDAICPLDSWVLVLAGIALVCTTVYLKRKQSPINSQPSK